MGFEASSMVVWDPRHGLGGLEDVDVKQASFLLWKGHCSVHQRFRPEHVAAFRDAHPGGLVVVHPECSQEVVAVADRVGSTDFIIRTVDASAPGTAIGIGTEIHLVKRLADEHPDRVVECLDPNVCPCTTMSRIDAPHLAWVLEELVEGRVRNQISVDDATATDARVALERMLSIS
jgi:quinolinate synthase